MGFFNYSWTAESKEMEIDVMNTILFTNLQLLGMDTIAMEGKYHVPFSK